MFVTSGISVFLMQIIYYAAGKMTLSVWLKRNMEIKRSCSLLNVRRSRLIKMLKNILPNICQIYVGWMQSVSIKPTVSA
jgi:hypothetical protein